MLKCESGKHSCFQPACNLDSPRIVDIPARSVALFTPRTILPRDIIQTMPFIFVATLIAMSLSLGMESSLLAQSTAPKVSETTRLEFFESKIRPVLVQHCYECHSATAKHIKGGLLVDTRAGMLRAAIRVRQLSPKKSTRAC